MNRYFVISALLLLLAGCGGASPDGTAVVADNNNNGLGFQFDESDDVTGLRARWDGPQHPTLAQLEEHYRAVAACVGTEPVNGPLVIYQDFLPLVNGHLQFGVTMPVTNTILIWQMMWRDASNLTHEYVHYLKYYAGHADWADHSAVEFTTCVNLTAAL